MNARTYPYSHQDRIPAECYNRLTVARLRAGGYFQLAVAGLSDNIMVISGAQWRCWNRRLGVLLLSWQNFRSRERTALDQPVDCTMTIHHSYSRTIIHRLYDGLMDGMNNVENFSPEKQAAEILPITDRLPLAWVKKNS